VSTRLAIVATHPIQYAAPWFRSLACSGAIDPRVFYLWDFGVAARHDPGFGQAIAWDVPLLEGYEHQFVPNRSRAPGTHRALGLWNPTLRDELARWRPDAVLVYGYRFATLLDLVARWSGAPLVFRGDSHRLVARRGPLEAVRRRVIAAIFRRFGAFLHVGSANRAYFEAHGVPASKLFFAPHAVDNARFAAAAAGAATEARAWRSALGIPERHAVVLFAGKLEEKKRPLDLLEAFRRARLADATLFVVGSGPLEPAVRAAARDVPGVVLAPFQNQSLMPRTYACADLFVLPSLGPEESWGLAVNEAMCMGRAAIVSSHVGCGPDLVRPRETGLVFPAGDVDALAAALAEALADRARLAAWGARARAHVAGYSYAQATAGLTQALRHVGAPP
jgi:glycosyltransferase involved in cell wall biosynthesis